MGVVERFNIFCGLDWLKKQKNSEFYKKKEKKIIMHQYPQVLNYSHSLLFSFLDPNLLNYFFTMSVCSAVGL